MPIKHYQVLQTVLSQTRDTICRLYNIDEHQAFERAEMFIQENSQQWRLSQPIIQYEEPFCRMAYLYMNVAIHASLVEQAVQLIPSLTELIASRIMSGDELRLCALGGGPGSELLGLVRLIENLRIDQKPAYLDFLLVDRVKEWDESWHALKKGIDDHLKFEYGQDRSLWPTIISRSFLPLNVSSVSDFEFFATRFYGTDLYLSCYLVSELTSLLDGFQEVFSLLVKRANPGTLFLFIDRDEAKVRQSIQELVKSNESLITLDALQKKGYSEDNLKDLGEWYIHIPSLPRQKWLTFFLLAQKI